MAEQVKNVLTLLLVLALTYTFLHLVFIAYFKAKLAYVQALTAMIIEMQAEQKATRAESA